MSTEVGVGGLSIKKASSLIKQKILHTYFFVKIEKHKTQHHYTFFFFSLQIFLSLSLSLKEIDFFLSQTNQTLKWIQKQNQRISHN